MSAEPHDPRARAGMDLPWFALGLFALGIGREFDRLLTNLKLHDLGLGDAAIGRVVAAHQLGTWIAALPTAFLLARVPLRWLLTVATGFTSLGLYLVHRAAEERVAILGELLLGAGLSIPFVAALPLAFERAAGGRRTFWIAVAPATYAVSGIFTSPLAGMLAEIESPEAALGSGALFPLAALIAFWRLADLPTPREERGRAPRLRGARRLLVVNVANGLATGLSVPFLNLFLRREAGFLPAAIGTAFAVVHVASSASYFAAPRAERWCGTRRGVIAGELLIGSLVLLLALVRTPALLLGILVLRGASMALTFPLFKRMLLESVARGERRWLAGISAFLWNASLVLGSVLGGALLERTDFTTLLALAAVPYLAGALLLALPGARSKPGAAEPRTPEVTPDDEAPPPHGFHP